MRRLLLLLSVVVLCEPCLSQPPAFDRNLVANPGFEDGTPGGAWGLPALAPPWQDVSGAGGTFNAIFDDRESDADYYIPSNDWGYELQIYPGHRYAGLFLNNYGAGKGGIAIELDEPLKPFFEYEFEISASRAEDVGNNRASRIAVRVGNNNDWSQWAPDQVDEEVFFSSGWHHISSTAIDVSEERTHLLLRIRCMDQCLIPFPDNRAMYLDNVKLRITGLKDCYLTDFGLELQNKSINSHFDFKVISTITVDDLVIQSDGDVLFQAGNRVTLGPGTRIEEGANVHAIIAPCNN